MMEISFALYYIPTSSSGIAFLRRRALDMRIVTFILHLFFPILLSGACYLTLFLTNLELDPLVRLPQGAVRGLATEISKEISIESFQGIRYAHAPIGNRRWRRPLGVWEQDDAESHLPLSERALSITRNRTGSGEFPSI